MTFGDEMDQVEDKKMGGIGNIGICRAKRSGSGSGLLEAPSSCGFPLNFTKQQGMR
jgi:hypothetical protein